MSLFDHPSKGRREGDFPILKSFSKFTSQQKVTIGTAYRLMRICYFLYRTPLSIFPIKYYSVMFCKRAPLFIFVQRILPVAYSVSDLSFIVKFTSHEGLTFTDMLLPHTHSLDVQESRHALRIFLSLHKISYLSFF